MRGKTFTFTGRFTMITKLQAGLLVEQCGGEMERGIDKSLDYLVRGQGYCNTNTSRLTKARAYQHLGHKVKIISEQDLMVMLCRSLGTEAVASAIVEE